MVDKARVAGHLQRAEGVKAEPQSAMLPINRSHRLIDEFRIKHVRNEQLINEGGPKAKAGTALATALERTVRLPTDCPDVWQQGQTLQNDILI